MQLSEREEELLEKAREEEKACNWVNALKLYDQAAKSYLDKKKIVKAMEIFKDLTKKYLVFGFSANTAVEYLEISKAYCEMFKEGAALFKQNGNELESLELDGNSLFYGSIVTNSIEEAERMVNKALELNSKLFETYSKKKDEEIPLRIITNLSYSLSLYVSLCKESEEVKRISKRIIELSRKVWKLSMEKKDIYYITNSLSTEFIFTEALTHIDSEWLNKSKEDYKDVIHKCEESLKILKPYNNPFLLTFLYYTYGCVNCEYGHKHTEDEIEQRTYFDKGLNYLEMSLDLAREVKSKYHIVMALFFLNQYAFLSGKYMYLQKRIMNDIKEISEAGKIFAKSTAGAFESAYFYMDCLPAFYYSNFSQSSLFTPTQRKSYAKKGIEYGLRTLDWNTFELSKSYSFISLTLSYAVLVRFSESNEEQDIHIKCMLDYANKAKELGEKYGGGIIQAFAYNSQNRAYKTLADITKNKQERIKMLSFAADASKNYLKYAKESRTGIIAAQMRLALLYEEIGILTKVEETLNKTKELLQDALKSSLEKGYFSYAATTYEYIARIEDRLGNHTASA
ncbi:MAG: hypothetical protein ACFFB8_12925, partial [Promethearchaeota archaeon]